MAWIKIRQKHDQKLRLSRLMRCPKHMLSEAVYEVWGLTLNGGKNFPTIYLCPSPCIRERSPGSAASLLFVHSRPRAVRERKWAPVKLLSRQSQQTKDQFSAFVLSCSSAWCLGNSYWQPSHTERHFRYIWHKYDVPFLWVTFTRRVQLSHKVAFKNILKGSLSSGKKK